MNKEKIARIEARRLAMRTTERNLLADADPKTTDDETVVTYETEEPVESDLPTIEA